MMDSMRRLFVIFLMLNYWTLHTSQLNVMRSVEDLIASLHAYTMEGHTDSFDEINDLVPTARDYARAALNFALAMVSKQLKPMLDAIENAKTNGILGDCMIMYDKMEEERKYIIQQAADALGDCDGVEEDISYLVEDVAEVIKKVEDHKGDAVAKLLDCTSDLYLDEVQLQQCLNPVYMESRTKMNKLMKKKMKMLRHSLDETLEGVDEYMFRCLINARVQVLRRSREAANRINPCVRNNKIPPHPPRYQKMPWEPKDGSEKLRKLVDQRLDEAKKKEELEEELKDD